MVKNPVAWGSVTANTSFPCLIPRLQTRFRRRQRTQYGWYGLLQDVADYLPFLTASEREQELELVARVFRGWKTKIKDDTALRGVPLYLAFMHTGRGIKILEINSRPGDPEIMNLLPIIKDDFVDVCLKMVNGNLNGVAMENSATVLTYKVPADYGGYADTFPDKVE